MPKNHKKASSSSSSDRVRLSPYDCNSKNTSRNCNNELERSSSTNTSEEKDQWERAICPICMEHPHNAVMLICSSHEKGCRPYMCDTSYRHSNCFDQFCKLHGLTPSKSTTSTDDQPNGFSPCENREVLELVCPLCRGYINGWIVVQGARTYLNSRIRGCALESCDFSGNYGELRKHARLQHPSARPTISVSDNNSDNSDNTDNDITTYINNARLDELLSPLVILNRRIQRISILIINSIINQSRPLLSEVDVASR